MEVNISKRVKKAIKESGLTLYQLQQKTGIPKSAIQRYYSGDTEKLPITRLLAIAKATNVSVAYITGLDEDLNSETHCFTDASSVIKFMIKHPKVADCVGYDLKNMDEDQITEFTKTILILMKATVYQKKYDENFHSLNQKDR